MGGLFNNSIDPQEYPFRDINAEFFGRFEIHYEFEYHGLLDGRVSG
jgi:hypothetical protein